MTYKNLKVTFSRKGFDYSLHKRTEDKAIYKQKKGRVVAYEVIKIRKHDGYTIAGIFMEPSEIYPSDNEWGTYGWTYNDLESAEKKYNNL